MPSTLRSENGAITIHPLFVPAPSIFQPLHHLRAVKKHFLLQKNSLQNCFVGKRNISAKSFSTFTSKKTGKLCTKTQNQTKQLQRFYFEQNPSKWSEFWWWKCGKTSSGLQENWEKLILFSVCRISMQRVYLLSYLSDFLINNCEMTCNLIKNSEEGKGKADKCIANQNVLSTGNFPKSRIFTEQEI